MLGRRAFRKVGQMSCGEMVDLLIPPNMHISNEVPSRSCSTQCLGYKENLTVLDRVPMSTEGKLSGIQRGWC